MAAKLFSLLGYMGFTGCILGLTIQGILWSLSQFHVIPLFSDGQYMAVLELSIIGCVIYGVIKYWNEIKP